MTGHAYALALALCAHEDAAPLPVRAVWLSFLRRSEPHPADVREGAVKAHLCGHMRVGQLTPDGVRAALEALSAAHSPPSLYAALPGGQVVKHGKP